VREYFSLTCGRQNFHGSTEETYLKAQTSGSVVICNAGLAQTSTLVKRLQYSSTLRDPQ